MGEMTAVESLRAYGVKRIISYIDKNPEKNIPKLVNWLDKHDSSKRLKEQLSIVRKVLNEKDGNWYKLIKSLWTDIDDGQRKKLIENFVVNASIKGTNRRRKLEKQLDCSIPWAILLDPTSACNLSCVGCWAADYGNRYNLTLQQLDDIICQAKKAGVHFFIFSGGEPLIRKKDILTLCEKHGDCAFLAFTNGTLIDEEFADGLLKVKNFVPAISVEGFKEATDERRGEGTYGAAARAMEILKNRKLLFGISCCYTSRNTYDVGSEEFIDDMIEKGAKFEWLFTYMPVGTSAAVELLASAEQRKYMYERIRAYRKTKQIFTMDFWNDGEFVCGCIAAGRKYIHINANGDIEPCAFIHYSDSNIKDKTLLEAFGSPFFKEYCKNQPFNDNHLRPCPLLDNPQCLAKMVEKSGAKSTDMQNPEDVWSLAAKCRDADVKWAPVADEIWQKSRCAECKMASGKR